ncbi:MAG: hypothetical protein DMD60_05860 [Gemmatimonadetes bacterium]|nr:MAG: hypothetical protein DMD60_05860 [Gemmatimonadota bacterium]
MSTMSQRFLTLAFATLAVGMPLHAQRKTNLLKADEIERAKLGTSTAYEVVEMLRPRWLSKHELARIPGTPTEALQDVSVRVWLNGHNAGNADYLRTIPAERVLEMRWYSATEAANHFGPTDGNAAIEVMLQR